MSFSQADLGNALSQCAGYADSLPWGSPDLLFALASTADLAAEEPGLIDDDDPSALSPVLQETDPDIHVDQLLATTGWPAAVEGCALVTEITVKSPDDPDGEGRRARLIGGALRSGQRVALLSLEPTDDDPDPELRTHPDLAPNLLDALAATFDQDVLDD
ncbi:MAG: PPA1309 family protein [Gordonia sp. (in: high G+C Gram-positive bacteria)]|uniref:PPA1309 family protein n=1 Tax=Gordonia sp. (in: high G+C Gram-positive bacteria) TaxID=84139 RepID=UPI0039E2DB04